MIDKVKTPHADELDSISKRLRYIVDTLGVKQSHMAEKLGVSPSGLNYILNNDVKFSKNIKKIADFLKVNEKWLATGEGEMYEENTSIKTYKVPVYYPDQLKLKSASKQTIHTDNFYLTTTRYLNNTFAIYITDTHFSPKFEVGDIVMFEQTTDFEDGEIVLFHLIKTNALIIKYAFRADKGIILLSPDEQPIHLSTQDKIAIVGIYRECLKKGRMVSP